MPSPVDCEGDSNQGRSCRVAASGGSGSNCGRCRSEQNFGWYFQSRSESGKLPVTEVVIQSPAVNPAGIWKSVSAWARARGTAQFNTLRPRPEPRMKSVKACSVCSGPGLAMTFHRSAKFSVCCGIGLFVGAALAKECGLKKRPPPRHVKVHLSVSIWRGTDGLLLPNAVRLVVPAAGKMYR